MMLRHFIMIYTVMTLSLLGCGQVPIGGRDGDKKNQPAPEEQALQGSWRGYLRDLSGSRPDASDAVYLEIKNATFSLRYESDNQYAKGSTNFFLGKKKVYLTVEESNAASLAGGPKGFYYELQGDDLVLTEDLEKGIVINLKREKAPDVQGYWVCTDINNNQWSLDIRYSEFSVTISAKDRAALTMLGRTEMAVDETTNALKVPSEALLTVTQARKLLFTSLKVTSLRTGSTDQGKIRVEVMENGKPSANYKPLTCQTAAAVG